MTATDLFVVVVSFIAGVLVLLGFAAFRISTILPRRPTLQQRQGPPDQRRSLWRPDPLAAAVGRFLGTPEGQSPKRSLGFVLLSIVVAVVLVTLCAGVLLLFRQGPR